MSALKFTSPAKINLFLHIVGKDKEGYHLLETLMYPIKELHDEVEIIYSNDNNHDGLFINLKVENFTNLTNNAQDNLIYKACIALFEYAKLKKRIIPYNDLKITLNKNIPVGGGLGGGSSNAASTLLALNKLWQLKFSVKELHNIALKLGADVPFFLYQKPGFMTGRGDIFNEVKLPDFKIKILTNNIFISTKAIFTKYQELIKSDKINYTPKIDLKKEFSLNDIIKYNNDLQKIVLDLSPEFKEFYNNKNQKCALFRMSGSGSSCFMIY